MPITYACDNCHETSTSLVGWIIVSVNFIRMDPNAPNPPGGRTLDSTAPDLLFDKVECRDAWCTKSEVPVPT